MIKRTECEIDTCSACEGLCATDPEAICTDCDGLGFVLVAVMPEECSGDDSDCPENDGTGCFCTSKDVSDGN